VEGQSVFGRDKATHFMPLSSRLAQWEKNKIHPLKVFSKPGTCSLYDFTRKGLSQAPNGGTRIYY